MKNNAGFTLIEIAIVLVIIGLLAGGILKGQQMIENSKYKAWVEETKAYRAAVYTFQDRYHYLPGDLPNASSKLPSVDGIVARSGNGDGLISSPGMCDPSTYEGAAAIMHLRLAGLTKGELSNSGSQSTIALGGNLCTITATNGKVTLFYYGVHPQFATRIDEELDDGIASSGTITVVPYSVPGTVVVLIVL